MNENGTKQVYEWIGRGVVKLLLEFGIMGMLFMLVLISSKALNKAIGIFYTIDSIEYKVLTMIAIITPAVIMVIYGIGRGLHEKIAAHIMENATLKIKEKTNIVILALYAGLIIGGVFKIGIGSSVIVSIAASVFMFFAFFLSSYGVIYFMRKRKEKKQKQEKTGTVEIIRTGQETDFYKLMDTFYKYCYVSGELLTKEKGKPCYTANRVPEVGQKDFFCVICGKELKDHEKNKTWKWKYSIPRCISHNLPKSI